MATRFLEAIAMDLKFYDKIIIVHLIDLFTRFSAATTVDNSEEFANEELISLAE